MLYGYNPNQHMCLAAAAIFLISFLGHLGYMIKKKSWYLTLCEPLKMTAFTIGAIMEVLGYLARYKSARSPDSVLWYAIQSLFIILAPSLLAASHYMIFGRLMREVGEEFAPIRASRVTKIFVIFDALIQSSGDGKNANLGKWVLIVGFVIQLVSFGVFGIVSIVYHRRARASGIPKGDWTKCLSTLYVGIALILVRSVFRLVEFASGGYNTGYILTHEAFFYVLETLPVALVCYFFLFSHPTRYLGNSGTFTKFEEGSTIALHPQPVQQWGPGYGQVDVNPFEPRGGKYDV
ncbi:hypothetical protein MNV49_001114 [Pseudohyphozyma bogoriensis]|nr:hypothetical protein MNV49_001114 [Pseudohyphozyma bogoriensis]